MWWVMLTATIEATSALPCPIAPPLLLHSACPPPPLPSLPPPPLFVRAFVFACKRLLPHLHLCIILCACLVRCRIADACAVGGRGGKRGDQGVSASPPCRWTWRCSQARASSSSLDPTRGARLPLSRCARLPVCACARAHVRASTSQAQERMYASFGSSLSQYAQWLSMHSSQAWSGHEGLDCPAPLPAPHSSPARPPLLP